MARDTLIEPAHGETGLAEVAIRPGLPRPASAAGMARLDQAVTAGLATFVTCLWAAVLLLAAGWLADLFRAALPWSLVAYLAAVAVASVAIGCRYRRCPAAEGARGCGGEQP